MAMLKVDRTQLIESIRVLDGMVKLHDKFGKWYGQAIAKRKTIFDALDQFTKPTTHFDFAVGFDFIYKLSENLHFVPSVEDLYWMELEVFNRDGVKDFIRRLLGKISNAAGMPQYDLVLFDCPPSFTLLSYSVLSCCDLILIPVNPDFFASKGSLFVISSSRPPPFRWRSFPPQNH
jgi:chromosome partitioning protein